MTEWLTTIQVAERLNLSKSKVESMRYDKTGPAFAAFGKSIRYHVRDVGSWEVEKAGGDSNA